MHDTAYEIGARVIAAYASPGDRILEIGSLDVNGSLRPACPEGVAYLGIDVAHGAGVDIVARAGEPLPVRSAFCDLLISSSQMEHDPRFWQTFLEFCRVTKPGGVIYLSAPSNGNFHSYPLDVWRFYPDAGKALEGWANDQGFALRLVESFTARRRKDVWNDFVAIFRMAPWPDDRPVTFLSDEIACHNIRRHGSDAVLNFSDLTEDQCLLRERDERIARLEAELAQCRARLARLDAEPPPDLPDAPGPHG